MNQTGVVTLQKPHGHNCGPRALAFILLALLSLSRAAIAMDFSITPINPFVGSVDPVPYLLMKGEILSGDYERLLRFAVKNNIDMTTTQFILQSPGGDVSEALKIGRFFKSVYATVAVGPTFGKCASACFILFVSSVERHASDGLVGIHRPYVDPQRLRSLSPGESESLETNALREAEKYLHDLRVPNNLVDEMFQNASTEIHWLTNVELNQLGMRPPWYEEYLIARCGLDKAAESRFLNDPDNNQSSFEGLMKVVRCGTELSRPEALKSYNAAVAPYGVQYGVQKRGTDQAAGTASDRNHEAVYAALAEQIPNWKTINKSEGFLTWLRQPDVFAGKSRLQLLTAAFNENDAQRVLSIFKAYIQEKGPH
jgi:hypothetical protein